MPDGRTILTNSLNQIRHAGASIDVLTRDERAPIEYRQKVRAEQLFAARQAAETARRDLTAWAAAERTDATRRLNKRDTKDAAAESRAVAQQLKITRLVDAARANGNAKTAAADLQERANMAYSKGDTEGAFVLATAASELVPSARLAQEILGNIEADEILADPGRARALRELNDIDVVMAAAERDLQAAMAETLMQSSRAARDLGEHGEVQANVQAAAEASVRAKTAAFMQSQRDGTPYQPPVTGISELPENRGGAPDGARLLSREESDAILRAAGAKK